MNATAQNRRAAASNRWARAALVLVLCVLAAAQCAFADGPLKVVSWNIEWFPAGNPGSPAKDTGKRMQACQAELRKMNPDIFIGIEMRDWDAFYELCSAVPGLTVHVVSTFRDPETGEIRPQQIGIASKLRCRAAWWEAWKANVPLTPRGFAFAALSQNQDGKLIMVYGNHFKSNRGSENEQEAKVVADMRNDQSRQLLAHITDAERLFKSENIRGWIVAGDFNTNQDKQFPQCHAISILEAGGLWDSWHDVPREKRLTWRGDPFGRYKPTTFDHIFLRGFGERQASIVEVPRELSDHYPITVTLP